MDPLPAEREETTMTAGWVPAAPSSPPGIPFPHRSPDAALRRVWREVQPIVASPAPGPRGWQAALKRMIDIVGAGLGLILLSPLFAVVAAVVRLESPGAAIFSQRRVGRGGRWFNILKFRTMVDDAEQRREELLSRSVYSDPRLFKVRDDPRLTRIGGFLRRSSLDELPQLVNVLRGEMSLVGPRPPLPSEVELYEDRHYGRFDVKPGITWLWQVSGRNDITDFEQVVQLEIAYIHHWSLLLDIVILLRTIPAVFTCRGAH